MPGAAPGHCLSQGELAVAAGTPLAAGTTPAAGPPPLTSQVGLDLDRVLRYQYSDEEVVQRVRRIWGAGAGVCVCVGGCGGE